VASFAFRQRHAVLDTNVRRVLARAVGGEAQPEPHLTAEERARAQSLLPDDPETAARWAVGVMELGALVCTARDPRCADCPVRGECAWLAAGRPEWTGARRPAQGFAGTDRQVRGLLLSVLRERPDAVPAPTLDTVWSDAEQRRRALAGLVDDGLVVRLEDGRYALPA
jgi:A/G-specific adenine glycosylase